MPTAFPQTGELRYKVDIVQPDASTGDGYDEDAEDTFVLSRVWANVEDLAGIELVRAQLLADKATHRVTIRYRDQIQAKQHVLFQGRTFRIAAVLDAATSGCGFPRKTWLHLLCVELETD